MVTNGLKTAWMLSDYNNISVMCTGGTLREHSKSLVGQPALDYAARLNAITQGAGSYSMELAGYAPVPMQRQVELASNYHRKDEDE